nr:extensin-like [Crassostrea gigas]
MMLIGTCEYKGQQYLQGQQWYDGCDFSCICEDCVTGVYRCNQRSQCPTTGNYNTAPPLVIQGGKATPSPTLRPIYTPQPTPFIPNPNYNGFTSGTVYTPRPTPAILIPGRPYPSGTPYPGGTYPPGGGTYPPGFSPVTTQVPYSPVVVYFTNAPLIPCGTYPPRQTPFVGGTYPTGTVPPRTYTPFVGGTYPPSQTFGPYFTQPTFRPYQTYPTDKTPYVGGTYPTGTVPPPTPFVGGTHPPGYTPRQTPPPKPQAPILVLGAPYPSRETPYPGRTFPTGTVRVQYTPFIDGCLYKGVSYNAGKTWKDGCFYTCECLDMQTGRYRCKDRCPSMDGVVPPPNCQIVSDPADPCCKMMQCRQPAPAPSFNLVTGNKPPITGSITFPPQPNNTQVPNPYQTTPDTYANT